MLTSTNEYMEEAARTIFEACTDAEIRKQCEARKRHEQNMRRLASLERDNLSLKKDNLTLEKKLTSVLNEKAALLNKIAELENQLGATPPET